jgi:hypothetical protein
VVIQGYFKHERTSEYSQWLSVCWLDSFLTWESRKSLTGIQPIAMRSHSVAEAPSRKIYKSNMQILNVFISIALVCSNGRRILVLIYTIIISSGRSHWVQDRCPLLAFFSSKIFHLWNWKGKNKAYTTLKHYIFRYRYQSKMIITR